MKTCAVVKLRRLLEMGVALKANNAAQARQVVRDAMVGLGEPDGPVVYCDRHFVPQMETMRLESP